MKKIKKCKNCQYNINYYIDSIIEIKTENFICLKCNIKLSDIIEINNHKKKCKKEKEQFTIVNYFCSNECKFSYYIRENEKNINFRNNSLDFSKNICYDYYTKGFIISNSYESFNRKFCIT